MSEKDKDDALTAQVEGETKDVTFNDVLRNAITPDGAIDLSKIDSAPAVGYNGGRKCDVTSGPCSCGAWH